MKYKWKDNDDIFINNIAKYKTKCSHCGHVIVMVYRKYCICDWCGHKVYRSKKDEFLDKMKKVIK